MSETVTGLALTRLDYTSLDIPLVSEATLTVGDAVDPPEWDPRLPGAINVLVETGTRGRNFARSLLPIRHDHPSSAWWDAPTDLLAINERRVVRVTFTWPDDANVYQLAEPEGFSRIDILTGTVSEELTTTDLIVLADYP